MPLRMAPSDDRETVVIRRRIRVRGVAESIIYARPAWRSRRRPSR
jgi:hypothetical protein